MVKYRKRHRKDTLTDPLCRWLAWFDVASPPELITEVINMDSNIQAADERMVYVTGDKEAIRAYEMRMMALSDLTSYKNYAQEKGREEGLKEGLKEGIAQGLEQGLEQGRNEERQRLLALFDQGLAVEEIKRRL
jgi:flagellar biosynthesis/type III secretory pathway protein FliH